MKNAGRALLVIRSPSFDAWQAASPNNNSWWFSPRHLSLLRRSTGEILARGCSLVKDQEGPRRRSRRDRPWFSLCWSGRAVGGVRALRDRRERYVHYSFGSLSLSLSRERYLIWLGISCQRKMLTPLKLPHFLVSRCITSNFGPMAP